MIIKYITPTLLFYAAAAGVVFLLMKFFPSGPCAPGLGLLSFFLLFPVSIGLLIRNMYVTIKHDKSNLVAVAIHLIAVTALLTIMSFN
jgi:hypothetical protein